MSAAMRTLFTLALVLAAAVARADEAASAPPSEPVVSESAPARPAAPAPAAESGSATPVGEPGVAPAPAAPPAPGPSGAIAPTEAAPPEPVEARAAAARSDLSEPTGLPKPPPPTPAAFAFRLGLGPAWSVSPAALAIAATNVQSPVLAAFDWLSPAASLPVSLRLVYYFQHSAATAFRRSDMTLSQHVFEPSAAYALAAGADWAVQARAGLTFDIGLLEARPSDGDVMGGTATALGGLAALGVELWSARDPQSGSSLSFGVEAAWRQQFGGYRFDDVKPSGLNETEPARIPVTGTSFGTVDASGPSLRAWAGLRF